MAMLQTSGRIFQILALLSQINYIGNIDLACFFVQNSFVNQSLTPMNELSMNFMTSLESSE